MDVIYLNLRLVLKCWLLLFGFNWLSESIVRRIGNMKGNKETMELHMVFTYMHF